MMRGPTERRWCTNLRISATSASWDEGDPVQPCTTSCLLLITVRAFLSLRRAVGADLAGNNYFVARRRLGLAHHSRKRALDRLPAEKF